MAIDVTYELNPPPDRGQPVDQNQIYDIQLSEIYADEEFNCRGFLDPTEVIDLARDIREKGLIQPITVSEWSDPSKPKIRWRIICGYRRFKATRMNSVGDANAPTTIRASVRMNVGDTDARILNLTENLQRSQLNIKQEAKAIDHFRQAGMSEQDVADRLKVSRAWVTVRFMLMQLPEDIQNEVAAGLLTQHQVRSVHRLRGDPEKQYELVRKIKDAKIKGNKREVTIDKVVRRNKTKHRDVPEILELQELIRVAFGHCPMTKVLAWAAGEIDDIAVDKYLSDRAIAEGKFYEKRDIGKAEPIDPVAAMDNLGKALGQ